LQNKYTRADILLEDRWFVVLLLRSTWPRPFLRSRQRSALIQMQLVPTLHGNSSGGGGRRRRPDICRVVVVATCSVASLSASAVAKSNAVHEPTLVHGRQQGTGKDVDFTTRHRTKFLLVRSLAIISTVIFQAHGGQKGRGAKLTEPYNVGTHLTNSRCGGRDRRCMTNPRCSGRGRRCKSSATVSSTLPENIKASAYRTSLVKECDNFCTFRKYPSKFRCVFVASPYWCCCSMTSCKTRKSAFTPREPQISKARQESGACRYIFISRSFALVCAKPSAMSPGLPIKCDITKQPLLLFL
jgi:hypothetical protein